MGEITERPNSDILQGKAKPLYAGAKVAFYIRGVKEYEPEGVVTTVDEAGVVWVQWFDRLFSHPFERFDLVFVEETP